MLYLPTPRRLCFTWRLFVSVYPFVCLSVCLLATSCTKYWSEPHENFTVDNKWLKCWKSSASGSRYRNLQDSLTLRDKGFFSHNLAYRPISENSARIFRSEGASEKQSSLKARLRNGLTYLLTSWTFYHRCIFGRRSRFKFWKPSSGSGCGWIRTQGWIRFHIGLALAEVCVLEMLSFELQIDSDIAVFAYIYLPAKLDKTKLIELKHSTFFIFIDNVRIIYAWLWGYDHYNARKLSSCMPT